MSTVLHKSFSIEALAHKCAEHGMINLGQGISDLPIDENIIAAAYQAILSGKNHYSNACGVEELRLNIAEKIKSFNKILVDPMTELLVTHGTTGALVCAVTALFSQGDEVIIFEPYYMNHKAILDFYNIQVKFCPILFPDLSIDPQDLEKLIGKKTKGIILCSPSNPSGKIFSRQELIAILEICEKYNLYVITDEIYEHITYPGYHHISFASLPGAFKRTITISGFSKTFSMTGWRLGYASGPRQIIEKMAKIHSLLYVCSNTPLQHALLPILNIPDEYYIDLKEKYLTRRNIMFDGLKKIGFDPIMPHGTFYMMVNFSSLSDLEDEEFVHNILNNQSIGLIPGSIFYTNYITNCKHDFFRVCFCAKPSLLHEALERLSVSF